MKATAIRPSDCSLRNERVKDAWLPERGSAVLPAGRRRVTQAPRGSDAPRLRTGSIVRGR